MLNMFKEINDKIENNLNEWRKSITELSKKEVELYKLK